MSHFHVILQEIFHNLSIFQFSVSQIFSFSDSILGVPAKPSGFPLYLCSLSPALVSDITSSYIPLHDLYLLSL